MKTLLLNSTYEPLSFINEKKTFKLLFKEKAEIISAWEDSYVNFKNQLIHYPAVIKLKKYVVRKIVKLEFSRKAVFRRDEYACQYCLKPLCYRTATIDHIVPRKLGGQNNFLNCVTACTQCNRKKGNSTLADSGMKLVKQPEHPSQYYYYITHVSENWHQDWKKFLDI